MATQLSAFKSSAPGPSSAVLLKDKRRRLKPGESVVLWISRVVIWAVIIVTIIPILFVVTASFNPSNAYFSTSLIPTTFAWSNYGKLFHDGFWLWMGNSFLIGFVVATVQLLFTCMGAFAFSRLRFYGRKYGLMSLLILQMFPNFMAIAAIYGALAQFNMIDELRSYILVMLGGSAYFIWLMKGYFDSIPKDLDEAAIIDGANTWQRFFRVILPLAMPMLVVIFLFNFTGSFGDYIMSSTILQSPHNYTLALGMYSLISQQFAKNWGEFAAAALMAAIPLMLLFGLSQRFISAGLVSGATKG